MALPSLPTFLIDINQIKPSLPDTNNNQRIKTSLKKCLFGPADPEDFDKLLEQQFSEERQRFFDRFGIHMEDLENVAVEESPKKCDKLKMFSERISRRSRVLKPYNAQQMKMTDFCQVRKKSPLQKKL